MVGDIQKIHNKVEDKYTFEKGLKSDKEIEAVNGLQVAHVTKSGDYTATVNDHIIGIDDTSSARTVTLPTAGVTEGKIYIIVDESSSASTNGIDLATEGSANIDGSSSVSGAISSDSGQIRVYSDGTNWFTF